MLSITLTTALLFAQIAAAEQPGTAQALHLEAKIVKHSYCRRQPSDKINLALDLQLKFTNIGEEPIILYRKCDVVLRFSRSATEADARAGRYEEDWTFMTGLAHPHLVTGKEAFPPQDYFVILRPSESYYLNTTTGLSYCVPARSDCPALNGQQYVRIVFGTWKESLPVAEKLRILWRPFGLLWHDSVILGPMPFSIDEELPAGPCPALAKPGPFI